MIKDSKVLHVCWMRFCYILLCGSIGSEDSEMIGVVGLIGILLETIAAVSIVMVSH